MNRRREEEIGDEVWYQCPDCDGEGWVDTANPDGSGEGDDPGGTIVMCGECDGLKRIHGSNDPDDLELAKDLGWVRVDA